MSTPEDRLREVLRSSADELVPAGDGLSRIRARVARRRRLRWTLLPAAALAVTGATVAALTLGGAAPSDKDTLQPGDPTPTGPATPSIDPSPTPGAPTDPYDGPALSAYRSADKDDVVRHWLSENGIGAQPAKHECESCDQVPIAVRGVKVGDALLARSYEGSSITYTLVAVENEQLKVTAPTAGAAVATSFEVRGTVAGYHQSISLVLKSPEELGTAQTMAGQDQPWSATLTWQHREWSVASLIARTYSDKDGSLDKLVAVPVTRGETTATPSYAVLKGGHVEVVTGTTTKQVTFPPAGATDTALAYADGTLMWVRSRGECDVDLLQLQDGRAGTLVSKAPGIRTPRISPSGGVIAWVQQECGDGPQTLRVMDEAYERAITGPEGTALSLADVTDDGALLVRSTTSADPAGELSYLPSTATTWDDRVPLKDASQPVEGGSCYLGGAATFEAGIAAWETCDGRSRYVRFGPDGKRGQEGGFVDATTIESAAALDGVQLLQVRGRTGLPSIARYAGGTLTYVTTCEKADACQSSPDW